MDEEFQRFLANEKARETLEALATGAAHYWHALVAANVPDYVASHLTAEFTRALLELGADKAERKE